MTIGLLAGLKMLYTFALPVALGAFVFIYILFRYGQES